MGICTGTAYCLQLITVTGFGKGQRLTCFLGCPHSEVRKEPTALLCSPSERCHEGCRHWWGHPDPHHRGPLWGTHKPPDLMHTLTLRYPQTPRPVAYSHTEVPTNPQTWCILSHWGTHKPPDLLHTLRLRYPQTPRPDAYSHNDVPTNSYTWFILSHWGTHIPLHRMSFLTLRYPQTPTPNAYSHIEVPKNPLQPDAYSHTEVPTNPLHLMSYSHTEVPTNPYTFPVCFDAPGHHCISDLSCQSTRLTKVKWRAQTTLNYQSL